MPGPHGKVGQQKNRTLQWDDRKSGVCLAEFRVCLAEKRYQVKIICCKISWPQVREPAAVFLSGIPGGAKEILINIFIRIQQKYKGMRNLCFTSNTWERDVFWVYVGKCRCGTHVMRQIFAKVMCFVYRPEKENSSL